MKKQNLPAHHLHVRKRVHQNFEPFPHPHFWKNFFDKIIFFVGIINPLMTIPQVTKIWIEHSTAGVSKISWTTYFFSSIFWLIYGILHREWPIIFTNFLFVIINFLIILGLFLF